MRDDTKERTDVEEATSVSSNNGMMSYMRVSSSAQPSEGVTSAQNISDDPLLDDDLTSSLLPPSPSRIGGRRPLLNPQNRQAARQLMRRMGDYLAYSTLLTMLVVIPIVLYRALSNRKVDLAAFNSSGVMVCGTFILSLRLVYLHLTHWYMPEVQKYVVRILWMVPLYSIQSWLGLRFHPLRIYFDTIRDLYEAYVIASFVYYLTELLGGQEALVQILLQKTDTQLGNHVWPFSLILQPWELGLEFMLQCKHGVLQYVVFKIIATVLTFAFAFAGIYGEGVFSWKVAYPYMCFFQNISVMYALYSLVMLYSAVSEELRHPVDWKPLGKFLCIKGVVFFTWWQGVIIFYLRAHGIIDDLGSWSSLEVAYGLIDYCIVIEMVGFAIAHSYTFTYKEYLPSNLPSEILHPRETTENNNDDNEDQANASSSQGRSTYRPPATLPQPMNFKDALWSSTLPKETFADIQRLRTGIDSALNHASRDGSISLQHMESDDEEEEHPPEQTFV